MVGIKADGFHLRLGEVHRHQTVAMSERTSAIIAIGDFDDVRPHTHGYDITACESTGGNTCVVWVGRDLDNSAIAARRVFGIAAIV
jgi:hypothetical protein